MLVRELQWYKDWQHKGKMTDRSPKAHNELTDNYCTLKSFLLLMIYDQSHRFNFKQVLADSFDVIAPEDFFEILEHNSESDIDITIAVLILENAPDPDVEEMAEAFISRIPAVGV